MSILEIKMFMNFSFFRLLCLTIILLVSGCERPTDSGPGDSAIPPAVPVNIRVYFAYDGEILIVWSENREPGLSHYNIYRKEEDTDYQKIASTKNNYFFDDSLSYFSTYYYRVSAVDIWERESEKSSEVSAKPENLYAPKKPAGLFINARNWEGEKSIYLSWQRNHESDIAGYVIHRSESPDFMPDSSNQIKFTPHISFSDTSGLEIHKTYYYKIIAVDHGNLFSIPSDEVHDQIFDMPVLIHPENNMTLQYFREFILMAVNAPAAYKIIVQRNQYFDEFWTTEFSTNIINDTLKVPFNPVYLEPNKTYYWRAATYSVSSEPNSISPINSFTVIP